MPAELKNPQTGFTYLTVLFIIALMGIMLATTGMLWHTAQMRQKEQDLLFVGNEYRKAIQLYYLNTPGSVKQYPRDLSDLLKDPRQTTVKRYLRKIYHDPITGGTDWGIVRSPDGGIAGVYSRSGALPLKTANFSKADIDFKGKEKYSEWQFTYLTDPLNSQSPMRKP